MGDGYKIDWKLEQNIRENKVCNTCQYGTSFADKDEVIFCLYNIDVHPDDIPGIKTCLKWKNK